MQGLLTHLVHKHAPQNNILAPWEVKVNSAGKCMKLAELKHCGVHFKCEYKSARSLQAPGFQSSQAAPHTWSVKPF